MKKGGGRLFKQPTTAAKCFTCENSLERQQEKKSSSTSNDCNEIEGFTIKGINISGMNSSY